MTAKEPDKSSLRTEFGRIRLVLTTALGAMSFFRLIEQGFKLGIAAPLQTIVTQYDTLVDVVIEYVRPIFIGLLTLLHDSFGWNLYLTPDWKHVLVTNLLLATTLVIRVPPPPDVAASAWRTGNAFFVVFFVAQALAMSVTTQPNAPSHSNAGASALLATGGILLALGALRFVTSLFQTAPDWARWHRAKALSYVSIPLAVIFILITNAGLQGK